MNAMTKLITLWVCIGVTAAVVVYDVVIAIEPTPNDTISKVLRSVFIDHPSIALCVGVLGGHVTSVWRWLLPSWWYWVGIPLLVVLVVVSLVVDFCGVELPCSEYPAAWIGLGFPLGHVLWCQ